MGKVAREAAKLVAEDLNRLKETLAKQGKTLDEFLEEMRIRTEETRKRTAEKNMRLSRESTDTTR